MGGSLKPGNRIIPCVHVAKCSVCVHTQSRLLFIAFAWLMARFCSQFNVRIRADAKAPLAVSTFLASIQDSPF